MRAQAPLTASAAVLAFLTASHAAFAQVPPAPDGEAVLYGAYKGNAYSPYAQRGFPSRPLWGDTHLHTSMSMDAGAFGNRLGVREAYQFARGNEINSATGLPVKLSRAARLSGRGGPLRQYGFLPRHVRRSAAHPQRPDR